jgi:acidic leucine-rich nuclear phosphoprotein 32 family protein B
VTNVSGYKEHMWRLIPSLAVLDGYNKIGEEVYSESEDDYGSFGEEGEDDLDNKFINDHLTEEQLAELKKKGISIEEYLAGQDAEFDDEEGEEEYGEEGEDESEDEGAPEKRAKK